MLKMKTQRSIVRQLVFDLDGTLIDSVRLTCAIIDAMLAERGIEVSADPATARDMDSIGGEAMIIAVMGRYCQDPSLEIADFRARHALVDTPPDLAFPGVADGLARLAEAGLAMAICSNKPQPLCEKILADLGLARHFRAIVGARPGLPRKPALGPIELAMTAVGADPVTCLYVGDSAVDAATASAANIPFALVGWGYGLAEARIVAPSAPVLPSMADLILHILQSQ